MYGRPTTVRLLLLTAALFVIATNSLNIAGLLPEIAETLDVSVGAASYGITAYAAVAAIAAPLVSTVFSRSSRTTIMASGLAIVSIGTMTAAVAPGLAWFIGGRALAALGGAAVVPMAMAIAPEMVIPERRGRALALVGIGFTAATALGAPLATALASLTDWRMSMGIVAGLAALAAIMMVILMRDLPVGHVPGGRAFLTVITSPIIVIALLGNILVTLAMDTVYIFSAEISGQTGTKLASLLLAFGVGAILGNALGGRLSDAWGSGRAGLFGTAVLASSALVLIPAEENYLVAVLGFLSFGVASSMAVIPRQHQLIAVAPEIAAVALSWFTTAMYVGLALAPVVGASLMPAGGHVIAIGSAAIGFVALVVFALGLYILQRVHRTESVVPLDPSTRCPTSCGKTL